MNTVTSGHWWVHVLRRLPSPLMAALDAWSYRIARRRAEKRRLGK
ncbi:MAG: hypothetical protein ABI907_09765 [Ramlibacter sp.]